MFPDYTFPLHQIDQVAVSLLQHIGSRSIIAFYAPMGAGKTTLIKALVKALGSSEVVTSPTFALMNEYSLADGSKAFHFDFYRINRPGEALDIGIEEYFGSGMPCFLEWPENIEVLLPHDTLKIYLSVTDNGLRRLTWQPV